jgi:hypothetical protein
MYAEVQVCWYCCRRREGGRTGGWVRWRLGDGVGLHKLGVYRQVKFRLCCRTSSLKVAGV